MRSILAIIPILPPLSLSAVVLLAATPAAATDTWSAPFPGGAHLHRSGNGQDIHAVVVDLCAPGVRVRTTASGERGQRVSSFAGAVGAAVATNGDFFDGGFSTDGPAMHDGAGWGGGDHTYVAPVAFGDGFVDVPHHNNEGGPAAGAREVVSGHPTLLDDGNVVGNPGDPLCTNRHPRTMLGITQDHTHLIIAVADGRRTGVPGLTCDEEAAFMAELGAFDAVNLDGGGSADMVIPAEGGVQNRPSDGAERTVGNHFAIVADGAGPAPQCPLPPAYRAEFAAQSWPVAALPPVQIYQGDVVDGFMEMRNTGTATWDDNTKLAPIERDVASPLAASTWLSTTRVAHPAGPVAPGEVGRFALPLAGNGVGEFDQFFGLVQEGVTWFADQGGPADHFLEVRVTVLPKPAFRGRVAAVNIPAAVEEGGVVEAFVDVENIGATTWDSTVRLAPTPRDVASALAAPSWLSPTRVTSADGPVAPGAVGHFTFEIAGGSIGHIDQTFGLVADGVTWLADSGGPADDGIRASLDVVAAGTLPVGEGEGGGEGEGDGAGGQDAGAGAHRHPLPPSVSGCSAGAPASWGVLALALAARRRWRGRATLVACGPRSP